MSPAVRFVWRQKNQGVWMSHGDTKADTLEEMKQWPDPNINITPESSHDEDQESTED
jgi:hypothetical protein